MPQTLDDFLHDAWTANPPTGTAGSETDWLPFCKLTSRGTQLLVIDADFAPYAQHGLLVDLAPGEYEIKARVIDYGTDKRISRLRLVMGNRTPSTGHQLGTTWTDTGKTGVCDYIAYRDAWGDDDEVSWGIVGPTLEQAGTHGIALLNPASGTVLPFVTSGFGDGNFSVHELIDSATNVRIGVEVEFIASDTPYPF